MPWDRHIWLCHILQREQQGLNYAQCISIPLQPHSDCADIHKLLICLAVPYEVISVIHKGIVCPIGNAIHRHSILHPLVVGRRLMKQAEIWFGES